MTWRTAWPGQANTDITTYYRRLRGRDSRIHADQDDMYSPPLWLMVCPVM